MSILNEASKLMDDYKTVGLNEMELTGDDKTVADLFARYIMGSRDHALRELQKMKTFYKAIDLPDSKQYNTVYKEVYELFSDTMNEIKKIADREQGEEPEEGNEDDQ